MDWNELSGKVAAVTRFLRPLMQLEEVPKAIQVAKEAVFAMEEKVKEKQKEIPNLDKQIETRKKELTGLDQKHKTALEMQKKELEAENLKIKGQHQSEIAIIIRQKDKLTKDKTVLELHIGCLQADNEKLIAENAELTKKRQELLDHQEAIAKLLKK